MGCHKDKVVVVVITFCVAFLIGWYADSMSRVQLAVIASISISLLLIIDLDQKSKEGYAEPIYASADRIYQEEDHTTGRLGMMSGYPVYPTVN